MTAAVKQPAAGARALAAAIAVQKLPAFGASLAAIKQLTGSAQTSGQDLADAILRDPALTSSVLRAANLAIGLSQYREDRVRTVSRAVVVLGMNALDALCATSLAVEHMHRDIFHVERMREAVGRAIHAATQARDLGQRRGVAREDSEKLFVEAILSNLGEVAFWCFGDSAAQTMDALLQTGVSREQAEQQVLGMRFEDFSREILQHWGLESLLVESQPVALANELCIAAAKGWGAAQCREAVAKVAIHLSIKPKDASALLAKNATAAAAIAGALGLHESAKYIPREEDVEDGLPASAATYTQDSALQFKIMCDMVDIAGNGGTMLELFSVCVEGLQKAVGLDRVVLALFDAGRTELKARIAVGVSDEYREAFRLPVRGGMLAALSPGAIHEFGSKARRPIWLPHDLISPSCLLSSVSVGRSVLGVIYADRVTTSREIDDEVRTGFRVFSRQLDMACLAITRAKA